LANRLGRKRPQLPLYFQSAENPHPNCQGADYLPAFSASEKSMDDARNVAKSKVVSSIKTSIQVERQRVSRVQRGGGQDFSKTDYSQVITQKSAFRHLELIRTIEEKDIGDRHFAYVCLDLREAAEAIDQDLRRAWPNLQRGSERALMAAARNDRAAFMSSYAYLNDTIEESASLLVEYRAVAHTGSSLETQIDQIREKLAIAARDLTSRVSIGLSVNTGGPRATAQKLAGTFRTALSRLGLGTVRQQATCKGSDAPTYALTVSILASCTWGGMGHTCEPSLSLEGRDSKSGQIVFDTSLEDQHLRASANSSKEDALAKALGKIKPTEIQFPLRELLSSEIPIP